MLGITGPSIRTTRAIIETLAAARTARDSVEGTSRAIGSSPVIEDGESSAPSRVSKRAGRVQATLSALCFLMRLHCALCASVVRQEESLKPPNLSTCGTGRSRIDCMIRATRVRRCIASSIESAQSCFRIAKQLSLHPPWSPNGFLTADQSTPIMTQAISTYWCAGRAKISRISTPSS